MARPRLWGRGGAVIVGLFLGTLPPSAGAQFTDCQDTIALFSPDRLTISFESDPVRGNRVRWEPIPTAEGACFRLEVSDDVSSRLSPEIFGDYEDVFDRELIFAAGSDTQITIGDTGVDRITLFMSGGHPNPAVPPLTGSLNLSNRGGIFLADLGANGATQQNGGLPVHLPSTDVKAMAASNLSDGGVRIYAAVTLLPLARSDDGGRTWIEPGGGVPDPIGVPITVAAVSLNNPDLIFLGTQKAGLFRSDDGGATLERADQDLTSNPNTAVTLCRYVRLEVAPGQFVNRLYVALSGIGFFFSDDDGQTWLRVPNLLVPQVGAQGQIPCYDNPGPLTDQVRVQDVAVSPSAPNRLYVALRTWGVYVTDDDHQTWSPVNGGLVVCGSSGGRTTSVERLLVLDEQIGGNDVIFGSTQFLGVWVSTDSGTSWNQTSGLEEFPDALGNLPRFVALLPDDADPLRVIGASEEAGLLEYSLAQGEGSWQKWDDGGSIYTDNLGSAVRLPGGGRQILVGTEGAGIYEPGDEIDLTRAVNRSVLPVQFLDARIELGMRLRLGEGTIRPGDRFSIVGQTFQAFAVWRATSEDPETAEPDWKIIGLYDLTNPETCSPDPCDSPSVQQIPGCFADKRANCFHTTTNEVGQVVEWQFFDRDVFNGFTYQYAVSTLDYGYTGDVAPLSFNGEFVYSPRSAQESNPQATLFLDAKPDNFNRTVFQVNVGAAGGLENVYVVPNPLRRQAGWDSGDQSSVRFVNVTSSSMLEVFTLAGDLVRELSNVVTGGVERGNIEWDTRNGEGELVASGVYIYRVTDAQGGEFVGRLTIIR
jgi:hypothetical protein